LQRDGWSPGLLQREALLNVLGRSSRLRVFILIAVFLGASQVTFSAMQAVTLERTLDVDGNQGRNVLIFRSASSESKVEIDRASCDSLVEVRGVQRAGLIIPASRETFFQLGPTVPVVRASATLIPGLKEHDAVIGEAIWQGSSPVRLASPNEGGPLEAVIGTVQPAGIDTNSAVTLALRIDQVSGPLCFAVLEKHARADDFLPSLQSTLRVAGGTIAGAEILRLPIDPLDVFLLRPERWLPAVLGVLGGLSAGLLNRSRSGELAVYRLSGTSARSLALLLFLEQFLLAGILVTAGTVASVALSRYLPGVAGPICWSVVSGSAWLTVSTLTTLGMLFRSPMELGKDR
jgi:hypothetical protein